MTSEEVTEIVNQTIANIPEAETLTSEQLEAVIESSTSGFLTNLEALEEGQTLASDERQELQEAIVAVNGDITKLDEANQERFETFGETIDELFGNVNIDLEALQAGQLSQAEIQEAFESSVAEEFEQAEEERAVLGGSLGTLSEEVADIASDLIKVDGNIESLDENTQDRLNELGLDVEQLGLLVNVNFESLQEGLLSQESAMQELIEETVSQSEEEVRSDITGLGQQIGGVEAGLEGLGEGIAGLGEGLGAGLLGLLTQQQQLPQQIAAAMPRQPVKYDKFLEKLTPRKMPKPLKVQGMLV